MHYKPRSIAEAVDKVARQSAGKDWGLYASLLGHWTEIVGNEYARVTTPIKIAFPYQPTEARRKNGVLTVRLPKGLAMEFSYKADLIRQRINTYFGYEAFARVALEQTSLSPPPRRSVRVLAPEAVEGINAQVQEVENDDIRLALQSFGATLLLKSSEPR